MKQFYFFLIFFFFIFLIKAQNPTGSSTEVGSTEGQLSVSLSGSANYMIPIIPAPGINGVVPQISLAYNSQSGNGTAGYGWNIAGISTISRTASTKFHDGIIDPVDFDNLDRFTLDGQRLILKGTSVAYGANNAIYETESFSNIKVTSYGVHSSGANYGPAYFIVEYPDGSKAYYGNSTDSRSITDWAITYWENPQGVRISYNYILTNNILDIASVKYGTLSTTTPINEIKFNYNTRARSEQGYIAGQSLVRTKILSSINVIGNGIGFRNYILEHTITQLNYQQLKQITEKSGDNSKSYNPTVFEYDTNSETILPKPSTSNVLLGEINSNNSAVVSGDFDGDARMDFVLYPTTGANAKKEFWIFNNLGSNSTIVPRKTTCGAFESIFTSTGLTSDSKLYHYQGITVAQLDSNLSTVNFNTYYDSAFGAGVNDTKKVVFPQRDIQSCYDYYNQGQVKHFFSGDFNGDGLTDVIAVDKEIEEAYCQEDPYTGEIRYIWSRNSPGGVYFVDLDRRKTTDFMNFAGTLQDYFSPYVNNSKIETFDVNGDGKTDILHFLDGKISVYTLNNANQLELLWQTASDVDIKAAQSILPGDYNGDGKMDFIITKSVGLYAYDYVKYLSKGNEFEKIPQTYSFANMGYSEDSQGIYTCNLIPLDINSDGKTDIVQLRSVYGKSVATGGAIINVFKNANSTFTASAIPTYQTTPSTTFKSYPIPVFLSPKTNNQYLSVGIISNNQLYAFDSQDDFSKKTLIKSITTGNGVKETITYSLLQQDQYEPFYTPSIFIETFPNIDIVASPNFKIVTKIERNSASTYRKQLYFYGGAVSNLDGLGFIGFRSISKTNWYNQDEDIITTLSKNDISLRGANVENYTVLGLQTPLLPFLGVQTPKSITKEGVYTATGTDNLVATQNIILKPNTLIKSGSTFSAKINEDANASSNTPITFITKSRLIYESTISPSKVFKLQNVANKQYNSLENTSSETYITYDDNNNPIKSLVYVKEGGATVQTKTSEIVYNASTSSPYVVGRPKSKNQNIAVSGDVMNSQELYSYNNSLLTQVKKSGNNTDYITEDNTYDSFGNIKKKVITAPGLSPRETNYEYDSTGRFMTKSTDIEGLSTTFVYNTDGTLKSETNPYLQTTSYLYDVWFKKIKTTDYLNKNYTFSSSRSNEKTIVVTTGDDDSRSEETFDDLGRKIKTGVKNITGTLSYTDYVYDNYDRLYKTSEPYFGSVSTQWNETKYDVYGRVIKTTAFTGAITNISYSGLSSTTDDGTKTKISVKNAIGNIVSITDTPGGTILYTYFANGNLKESNYANAKITISQDGWGRKTKLVDTSAGTYTYQYNSFGEITNETTPSGTTTYTIDNFGKVTQKTIVGTNTNSATIYDYTGVLLQKSTFKDLTNGTNTTTNEYVYDSNKRISSSIETTPYAVFRKDFTYDDFGRIDTETSIASSNGKSSSKKIKKIYQNGYPWQILDGINNTLILWKTSSVDAQGHLLTAQNGPLSITKAYDAYGYVSQYKYDKTATPVTNVLTLSTNFEAKRGNLDTRINSLFSRNDSFKYDSQNRLIEFTNMLGIQETQAYDEKGRITQNNLGNYKYTKTDKPYQNSSVEVTPEAIGYYGMREGIFNESMEDKSGWGKEKYPNTAFYSYDVTKTPHTGKTSLKLANATSVEQYVYLDKWIDINNATTTDYTYSGWVYSDGPQSEIVLVMKDAQNVTTYNTILTSVTGSWTPITKTFSIPAGIKKIRLRLDNNGLGNIWFDDVQIRKTNVPVTINRELNISYNAFKSPVQIEETGVDKISFTYNDGNARSTTFYGGVEDDKFLRPYRKHYSADGSMEIKEDRVTGALDFTIYIGGDGYSAPVAVKGDGVSLQNYIYIQRDYQGTILSITNETGSLVEKRLFDAWGNIIKVEDGVGNILAGLSLLDRGFTGHEHLQSVNIIHMNGRVYDPKLHRFLQPDNHVQDPFNTQNYNRYGYCWNNPLSYTDPSGEVIWFVPLIYAAVNVAVDLIRNDGKMNFGQIAMSAGMGAVSGYMGGATTVGGAFLGAGIGQLNKFMPTIPIYQSDNFNIGISPMIGYGTSGFNSGVSLNVDARVGDVAFGASVGFGSNSGTSSLGEASGVSNFYNYGGYLAYNDGHNNYGLAYSFNSFDGKTKQGVAAVTILAGKFTLRIDEDYLGDKGDRYRTGGLLMTYKVNNDLTLAFGGSMMTGQALDEQIGGNPNIASGYGVYNNEIMPNLRGGTMYGGVIYKGQASFYGNNSEKRLHSIQNAIHRTDMFLTPYFPDRGLGQKSYSYNGGYNSNYLFY